MPDLLDGAVTLGVVLAMLAAAGWIAGRDRRRHDAEVDRRIRDRYRHG